MSLGKDRTSNTSHQSAHTEDVCAFDLKRPERATNVIFSSPHSGRFYPETFQETLKVPLIDLRRAEDAFVDELFADAPKLGASLLSARYARSFVDLNRSADEIDPTMFANGPSLPLKARSSRVRVGLGCIPRIASSGEDIHSGKLLIADAHKRLEAAYWPYHERLQQLVLETKAHHGSTILIECHSMPSKVANRRVKADMVLGNCENSSCDPRLTNRIRSCLEAMGYRVETNTLFSGGYITRTLGDPSNDVHSLQIEINRRLYLNEHSVEKTAAYNGLKANLSTLIADIIDWGEEKSRANKARQKV